MHRRWPSLAGVQCFPTEQPVSARVLAGCSFNRLNTEYFITGTSLPDNEYEYVTVLDICQGPDSHYLSFCASHSS